LLGQTPGLEVAGEAGDAASLLAQVDAASPQLVLLDWDLRDLAAAEILPALRSVYPDLRVIVLSSRPEDGPAVLATGADAFVSKADPADQLLATINDCCGRQPAPPIPRLAQNERDRPPLGLLSAGNTM
jgi:DNA-binding NarL/FixJ family response regulator